MAAIINILLVDDDKSFVQSTSEELAKNKRIKITCCYTAEEALFQLNSKLFDFVICDVYIPFFGTEEGGIRVAKAATKISASTFVVIVSEFVTENLIKKILGEELEKQYLFLNKTLELKQKLTIIIKDNLEKRFVFVCMPFAKKFENVYEFGIKEAVEESGLLCHRADEIQHNEGIIDKINEYIRSAHIVIGDMTDKNPNVFYEIGFAHASNKKVILITQKSNDIPVDLQKYNHIIYGDSLKKLKKDLIKSFDYIGGYS